ncbi:collagen-binding domain-containing protein [Glycomyces sp. NPDC048151]|uniref:collagen-binding domain-containing protein n=1 Tax=Glycomyces sp. NPDC048151 TaxID=3364002 RepID=UPI00371DFBDF
MPHTTQQPNRQAGRLALAGAATASVAVAIAVAGTMPAAQADVADPLAPALGFNSFVENETVLASTESEGGIATGGNLAVAGSYNVNIHDASTFTAPGDSVPSALVVGGQVDFTQFPGSHVVQVHDYMKVGDLTGVEARNTDFNSASVNTHLVVDGAAYESVPRIELNTQQPLDSVGPASPIDFAAAFTELRANAADLYACEGHEVEMKDNQGTVVPKGQVAQGQQIRIELATGQTNVLNVTGEDLNNMADLVFLNKPTADTPILINVDTSGTGGELDWDVKNQANAGGDTAPYMLWNFRDTTLLRLTGATVEGSILAPDADYFDDSSSNVEGQVIAKNAHHGNVGVNGGEIHHFPFDASFECIDVDPSIDGSTDAPTTDDATTSDGDDGTTGYDGTTGAGGEGLATTGQGVGGFVVAAAVLMGGGAAALIAMRRRRADAAE